MNSLTINIEKMSIKQPNDDFRNKVILLLQSLLDCEEYSIDLESRLYKRYRSTSHMYRLC